MTPSQKLTTISRKRPAPEPVRNLSAVVRAFKDYVFFTDQSGRIRDTGNDKKSFFQGGVEGRLFWEVLGLPVHGLKQTLDRFQPGRVHEIGAPMGKGTFSLRIIALPDADPSPGYVVIATDNRPIVLLKEMYKERIGDNIQALDNSIRLFGAIFDGVQDPMVLLAQDHALHAVNPKAIELLDPEGKGLIGRSVQSLFCPDDRERITQKLSRLKDGARWTSRKTCLDARGAPLPVEISLWRIDLHGVVLYHMVLRDLSAQTLLEKGLRRKRAEVEGMSLALRNVVRSSEEEKDKAREDVIREIRTDVLPALERMARENSPEMRDTLKQMIEARIEELSADAAPRGTGSLGGGTSRLMLKLTQREIEICNLIRLGSSTRDIAEFLNTSFDTVQTHRKNIRRKLGLKGRKVSLYSFLRQQNQEH
ncbi:PAS domain S-box-containing protein [Desulfonatronum thiosulfatophilum]|uniref:PAS domain S-box-containing protein n=1 Tax=Desulfonatronum thiosulfatophilum TaxID=617002 RepID=A0A1G6EQC6_9BACT|nr:LuxR C-terminal-related transcriptional regulator [Desulfonatronum thiosulfatophilum]SDB59627.1 PAS domain S-box-containing protein [Desulfonatronum thiosulfatophilum]